VKKKRRLSLTDEVDPNHIDTSVIISLPPRHITSPPPSVAAPTSLPKLKKPQLKKSSYAQPRRKSTTAITPEETAFLSRVAKNAAKPALKDMKGTCPIWSNTRKALQSAAEYLRDPVKTQGASVHIGVGGVARGLILEGEIQDTGVYWGEGEQAGSILTYM
jgi:hypothetical protein